MKKLIKYGVMLLLLTMAVVLPNTKADAKTYVASEGHAYEVYIDGDIYEGMTYGEILPMLKGEVYAVAYISKKETLLSGTFEWSAGTTNDFIAQSGYSGMQEWVFTSNIGGEAQKFHGYVELNIKVVPDLVVGKSTTLKCIYGNKLADIDPSLSFWTVAKKKKEGTFTWDNPNTILSAGTHQVPYTFTPTDSKYNVFKGTRKITITRAENANTPKLKATANKTSITIKKVKGCEYRIGNGKWNKSNVFKGLKKNTGYMVQIRYKETKNQMASNYTSIIVKTKK